MAFCRKISNRKILNSIRDWHLLNFIVCMMEFLPPLFLTPMSTKGNYTMTKDSPGVPTTRGASQNTKLPVTASLRSDLLSRWCVRLTVTALNGKRDRDTYWYKKYQVHTLLIPSNIKAGQTNHFLVLSHHPIFFKFFFFLSLIINILKKCLQPISKFFCDPRNFELVTNVVGIFPIKDHASIRKGNRFTVIAGSYR